VDSQEQTRQFLETLFHDLADNEQINNRPYIPDGYQAEGFINFFLDCIDDAVVACLRLREIGAHAYVSVNPRDREKVKAEEEKGKEGSPGGKSTVSRIITLFSDYDYSKMGQSREQALEYLRSLPCPPSMIIDSGGGLQLYWFLGDSVTSTEDKARAEKIMAGMCEWWQTDKVKDYSRVLRVPGTLNVKYDPPRECFMQQSDNGSRYTLDELWEMVPEEYHTPQNSVSPGPNGSHPPKEGRPLDPPDRPLGVGDGRHLKATRVIGYFASLKTKGGWPLPADEVKRNSEMWFENPNNCSAPLHLSDDPKEIKEWERLVSDICKKEKEKMKTKASENGLDPLTHSPPISTMGVSVGESHTTSTVASNKGFEGFRFTGEPEPPQREWVVDDLIPDDYPSTWYGAGGVLKSYLAMYLGLSVASPSIKLWMGHEIATGPVLYVDLELDHTEQLRRAKRLSRGLGLKDVPEDFIYLPMWDERVSFETVDDLLGEAKRLCKLHGVKLMILDSVGLVLEGDQNTSKDVLAYVRMIKHHFAAAGIPVLQIDHQGKIIKGENYKDKTEQGNSFKRWMTRSSFQLAPITNGENEVVVSFTHGKANFGPLVPPFHVKIQFKGSAVYCGLATEEDMPEPVHTAYDREFADLIIQGRATSASIKRQGRYSWELTEETIRNQLRLLNKKGCADYGGKEGKFIVYEADPEKAAEYAQRAGALPTEIESDSPPAPSPTDTPTTSYKGSVGEWVKDGKAEETRSPSSPNNIVGDVEITEEEEQ
jgi:AAA domain